MTGRSDVPTSSLPYESGIVLPCYEGSDGKATELTFSNTELCRSMLLLGSTGAGKTTALRAICRSLISQQSADSAAKPALIFFDFKGDRQTVEAVAAWARQAGRESDVRLLSLSSEYAYDFLAGLGSLADVQEYAERLQFGCGPTNLRDAFWDEYRSGLLVTALAFSHLLQLPRDFPAWSTYAASWLLADTPPAEVSRAFIRFEQMVDALPPSTPGWAVAQFAKSTIKDWEGGLDPRTRSNVRATMANALRPLLDPKVQHLCRASGAGYVNITEAIELGQIVLVSLPALLSPNLARLIGKALKADFYKAVFSRCDALGTRHRLAVLVADEYHLSATVGGGLFDDAAALPLIRGFGAGVVAATQTVANLDYTIGLSARNVLLPNFNSVFFFRTAETETARWASGLLGNREEEVEVRVKQRDPEPYSSSSRERVIIRKVERPICTLAELSRLEPGQAFVHRQFDPSPRGPVWLAECDYQ
jgi:type IV secretory pathway TraG/TraD family ATPase VirD4